MSRLWRQWFIETTGHDPGQAINNLSLDDVLALDDEYFLSLKISPISKFYVKNLADSITLQNLFNYSIVNNSGLNPTPRFHPGHLMWINRGGHSTQSDWLTQIDGIGSEPNVKGIKLTVKWGEMESATTPGDYSAGWALVDPLISRCTSYGKVILIDIEVKTFGGVVSNGNGVQPAYIKNNGGSAPAVRPTGVNWDGNLNACAAVWNQDVMDRFIAMEQAIAARYDTNTTVETFGFGAETATASQCSAFGFSNDKYLAQLKRCLSASRAAKPHMGIRVQANYFGSDAQMIDLFANCKANRVMIGGPDVTNFATRSVTANNIFRGDVGGFDYRQTQGMPWISEIQNYGVSVGIDITSPQKAFQAVVNGPWAQGMNSHYMSWVQSSASSTVTWPVTLAWINAHINDLAALNTVRPTGY